MTQEKNKYEKYQEMLEPIAEMIGIKLAPVEQVLSVYPDEFMYMEFLEEEESGAAKTRKKYSAKTQEKLIKAFRSHDWKTTSDIYGHNGLSSGGHCKNCKRKFKLPFNPRREVSDDEILAYHYIYGRHKRFGGRITKCRNNK